MNPPTNLAHSKILPPSPALSPCGSPMILIDSPISVFTERKNLDTSLCRTIKDIRGVQTCQWSPCVEDDRGGGGNPSILHVCPCPPFSFPLLTSSSTSCYPTHWPTRNHLNSGDTMACLFNFAELPVPQRTCKCGIMGVVFSRALVRTRSPRMLCIRVLPEPISATLWRGKPCVFAAGTVVEIEEAASQPQLKIRRQKFWFWTQPHGCSEEAAWNCNDPWLHVDTLGCL